MQSCTRTAAISGSSPRLVDVECSTTSGFAGLQLVGNTSDLCRDGKERAKTALERLGFKLGQKRILINLAPADCRKEGNQFDLPIAVSLAFLLAERESAHSPAEWLFAAELGLDGSLRPVRGVVPIALLALEEGLKGLVLPAANREEIRILQELPDCSIGKLKCLFFEHLSDVLHWVFEGVEPDLNRERKESRQPEATLTFDDMNMPESVQELAVCAAVGRHNVLLRGTPGCGKSMFAQRLPSLLPLLSPRHHFEVLQLYSLKFEKLPFAIMQGLPPIRSPHHSSSMQALLGTAEEPGDMALAHGGILFLDELPEFRRDVLESLREPMETGILHVSRAQRKATWQAELQLVAACNNCPCGYAGSRQRTCGCSLPKAAQYAARLSGPLLDRIDIHFTMPELRSYSLVERGEGNQHRLLKRVAAAREFMLARNERWKVVYNRDLNSEQLLEGVGRKELLQILNAMEENKLSTRSFLRALRVARTFADMEEAALIEPVHFHKAACWQATNAEGVKLRPAIN